MGRVKAETVQPRSLTVRLQRTKVYVKFICTGDRLAIKASEMDASRYLMVEYGNQAFAAITSLKKSGEEIRGVGLRTQTGRRNIMWLCRARNSESTKKILKQVLDRLIVAHRTMSMHTRAIAGLTKHYVFLEKTLTA